MPTKRAPVVRAPAKPVARHGSEPTRLITSTFTRSVTVAMLNGVEPGDRIFVIAQARAEDGVLRQGTVSLTPDEWQKIVAFATEAG